MGWMGANGLLGSQAAMVPQRSQKFWPAGVIVWLTFVGGGGDCCGFVRDKNEKVGVATVAAAFFSNKVLLKISRASNVK